jgi:GT2 family glycosyltransferase
MDMKNAIDQNYETVRRPSSVAILIVNYKTKNYVIKLLESFQKNEKYSGDVVFYIGDNASGDDLRSIPETFTDLSIRTFQLLENKGFGAGNNALVEKTKEPILFLVNPDIEWTEPVIGQLIHTLQETQAVVVGPKLYLPDWNPQHWDHGESKWIFPWIAQHAGSSFWKNQNKETEVAWVSWAAFMIRSKDFQNIGWFDENFFLYQEEVDLCKRIQNTWWVIRYNPTIWLKHHWSVVAKKSKYMIESVDLFLKKHHPILFRIGLTSLCNRIYFWMQDKFEKKKR